MAGRRFTREQKIKIGGEAIEAGNASLVGRRYQIHGTVVARWAKALQQAGEASFHEPRGVNTLKLTWWLRRQYALVINKKKVYRLCKQLRVLTPQRTLKRRHPKRLTTNREITAPNQLWETDVKYGYVPGERRFFFIMSLLDVYNRATVHSHIGLSATAEDAVTMLWQALWKRQLLESDSKPVIRSDNGPQFISQAFENWCLEHGVEHERIPFKTPNKNAHIEAFHRILEDGCLSLHEFETFRQAYGEVAAFMEYYNERRIHSAIHYMTPHEFHRAYESNGVRVLPIRV